MKGLKKGFTLIELLAVIIVLALILVFAIPAVLDTSSKAQKKSFATYGSRVLTLAEEFVAGKKLENADIPTVISNGSTEGFSLGSNDDEYEVCIVYTPGTNGSADSYSLYMVNASGTFYIDGKNMEDLKTLSNVSEGKKSITASDSSCSLTDN